MLAQQERQCGYCHTAFLVPERYANQLYCSQLCKGRAREGRRTSTWNERHKKAPMFERDFCAYDGEGIGNKLILLADSSGRRIWNVKGIPTAKALDFLLDGPRNTANVWYGFGWDINMILGDIPLRGDKHSVEELYKKGNTTWNGYGLSYFSRKIFSVKRFSDGASYKSFDVFGFFQKGFMGALDDWKVPIPPIIAEGKERRSDFTNWDKSHIILYNDTECKLLVALMDLFREALRKGGWRLSSWHGAGALASYWLKKHHADTYMVTPDTAKVLDASLRAYFGGRFEMAAWGHVAPIYHYDINSAYPASMRKVIDLSLVTWEHTRKQPRQDFSLVHVKWDSECTNPKYWWGPLPWRDRHGNITYPESGNGWYFNVEVKAAMRRYPNAKWTVVEAWQPIGPIRYPLEDVITEDYLHRARMKFSGDPASVPLKLALNSLYGKLAQKQGYQGKMPKYHNIMWAGWITAATRALISDALGMAKGKAVMVLCDGVYSLVPLKGLPISEKLGEWTYEEEDTSIDVIGAGIYQLSDGTNVKPFTRGFDYDSGIDIPGIVKFWESRCEKGEVTTTFDIQRFVGMGLALMGGKWEEAWRTFTPITREVNPVIYTGTSKRMPTLPFKKNRTTSGAHFLYPWPNEDESKLSYRYAHGAYDVEENEAVFRATAECEV